MINRAQGLAQTAQQNVQVRALRSHAVYKERLDKAICSRGELLPQDLHAPRPKKLYSPWTMAPFQGCQQSQCGGSGDSVTQVRLGSERQLTTRFGSTPSLALASGPTGKQQGNVLSPRFRGGGWKWDKCSPHSSHNRCFKLKFPAPLDGSRGGQEEASPNYPGSEA